MTTRPSTTHTDDTGRSSAVRRGVRWLVLVGTPVALAAVALVHPHAGEHAYGNVRPVADAWFRVHLLLLALYGSLGVGLYLLLVRYRGRVATIGRVGVAVYLVTHTAYESVVGIGTGVVLRGARGSVVDDSAGVEAAVSAIFGSPTVVALALVGAVGCLVAVVAIAVLSRRAGASTPPLALLLAAPVGLVAHSGLAGALSMLLFGVGVAWLELAGVAPGQ